MKKILMLILCFVLLSACAPGGSDSDTDAGAGLQNNEPAVRMAVIDGVLYRDSGKVSDLNPRCGTMDGEVVKTVEENEIPHEDHTSNFGDYGYQNATETSKQFNIDGDWVIFERVYDSGLNIKREDATPVGEKITLTELLGVDKSAAETVTLHYSPHIAEVDKDEFYAIADKIILTDIENAPMEKTTDGITYSFPNGIYIRMNGFDGYAFISDDCTVDKYGMHMSRMPMADYSIEKADLEKLRSLLPEEAQKEFDEKPDYTKYYAAAAVLAVALIIAIVGIILNKKKKELT